MMYRYFIEVSYLGTGFAGFQKQDNAVTIQSEIERVLHTYLRKHIDLTGSSRTDAGVHAQQNFFHFDHDHPLEPHCVYNLNAMLPQSIVIRQLKPVSSKAHCRFDAIARSYAYTIVAQKEPFWADRAYYFPYTLDFETIQEAAAVLKEQTDFSSFAKKGSQVKTTRCEIMHSCWRLHENRLIYEVTGNRFLRGMVRGLVGTMLQVGRRKIDLISFRDIILSGDASKASFAVPGHGLTLQKVHYPVDYFA